MVITTTTNNIATDKQHLDLRLLGQSLPREICITVRLQP